MVSVVAPSTAAANPPTSTAANLPTGAADQAPPTATAPAAAISPPATTPDVAKTPTPTTPPAAAEAAADAAADAAAAKPGTEAEQIERRKLEMSGYEASAKVTNDKTIHLTSDTVNRVGKNPCCRQRPCSDGPSFPSGRPTASMYL